MAYQQRHILTNAFMIPQISLCIFAEHPNVSHAPAVNELRCIKVVLGIVALYLLLTLGDVIPDQVKFFIPFTRLRFDKVYRAYVDVIGSLVPQLIVIVHQPPVLYGFGNRKVRMIGRNGLIPIAHLYRMVDNGDYGTMSMGLWHFNPVAHTHHVVRRDMYA